MSVAPLLEVDRVTMRFGGLVANEDVSFAVPAELGEDEILAAVVCKPGASLTAQDVAAWCARHLAPMKVPRYVLFMDSLPHTPTHKILKGALRSDPTLKARATDLSRV